MQSMLNRLLWCLILALLMPISSLASKRLNFTNYRTEQGLSSNYISDLAVDTDGFLWISTDYGLNRFDGAVFRTFLHENYPSLRRNDILQVSATIDNEVLVSGYNGFFQRYNPKTDKFDSIFPSTYFETVHHISQGGNETDNIVALASDGIYMKQPGTNNFSKNIVSKLDNSTDIKNLLCDTYGQYWVVYSNKLSIFSKKGECLNEFKFENGTRMYSNPLLVDLQTGRILVGGQNHKIDFYRIIPNGGAKHEHSVKLPFSNLLNVQVASDGSYWFASDGEGLWMSPSEPKDASSIERVLPYGTEPAEFKVYALATDKKGNVWVGTQNTGLWHCSVIDQSSSYAATDLGLPKCLGRAFCELPSGNMLVACDGLGICEFSEKSGYVGCFGHTEGLKNLNVTGVSVDDKDNIWATTWGGGLFVGRKEGDKILFKPADFKQKVQPLNSMSFVVTLPKDSVWVGVGGEGLYLLNDEGVWTRKLLNYPNEECTAELWPSFCFHGAKNEVWISTSFAMWVEKDGTFVPFGVDRFKNNDNYVVNDGIGVPGYGVVLATRSGLLVTKPGDEQFTELDICPKKEVFSVVLDKKGNLWAVVENSIWCFDLREMVAKRYPKDFNTHGKNYFLKHSKYCSSSGMVYFGSKDGFFGFNPNNFNDSSLKPSLFLSRLEVDGVLAAESAIHTTNTSQNAEVEVVTLPYGHNSFAVCVDMPDFSRYRPLLVYRLNGEEWLSLGTEQRILYSHLPAGSYLLEVKALGMDDKTAAQLKLEVEGPWWNSWWFRLLMVLTLLAAASWKVYTLINEKKLLQRMVDERTQELRQKSQLVEKRNLELNAALSTKDRLMAVVAHDLKNPAFAIVGALEGFRKRYNQMQHDECDSILDSMIGCAQTLQSELNKLLVWATSKQDDIEYRPSNADLAEIIESDLELLKLQAEEKGVLLKCLIDVPNFVYVDARMISTAIRNMLGNSLKFTPSGRSVMVRAWMADNSAFVEISDEGLGMSNEKLQELLSNEVNTSSAGTDGEAGSGLGIGFAKYYVKLNGGQFSMTSAEGVGTTVLLQLPVTPVAIPKQLNQSKEQELSFVAEADLLAGNCVLVVDDDPLIAQNVKSMLDSYVDVILAENGQEALKLVKENNVDVVVSDVEMPVMNGIEMNNSLQADANYNHIPVLFLSAKSTESDRLLGLLTGAVDYIPKPFNKTELLVKLNNILSLRRRQQQYLLKMAVGSSAIPSNDGEDAQNLADLPESEKKMNPFLQRVITDIENNYNNAEYCVEQLAKNLCTTRVTLYRKVKSLSGQNPSDLLIDYRLNKSCQLLKEGTMEVQDVAYAAGFSDYSYFAKRFKMRFGKLPKDFLPY